MESGNGGASSKGVLIPVPDSSDVFLNSVLAPLQSAYLYEESKQFFRYKSAVLVKNPVLEEKYNALRAKRKEAGYSEDDLKESYGFLLFDDATKANALGEAGVLAGNSTCTTLGDPSKGVYISMYSDCLDLNRWYHGKSGYIAIIRLTKGKVKKVLENYTQNFTAPTVGYDCHVSEQLPSVSAKTSSFLAFERTQYYMYELLNDGSNKTAQCPSAACPFAIVSFSYTDTKATPVTPEEKSEMTKLICRYLPWRGQLQIGSQFYSVGMRCTTGALIPAQLPPVVKVDGAICMSDLRKLLPRVVFETCIASEAFLDGLYCSLCELVPAEAEETSSLAQLLCEIKEKDLSLVVPLNDGGFLILLHSSHFLTYDDTGSSTTDVLQSMFVFPESRAVVRDTKSGLRNSTLSSEIHRVLPLLSYAEGEVEKTPIDPSEDLCEVLVQHMQSYAALINPGLAFSPSREVSIFPDQYDVPDAHKGLYSSPEWSNRAWQSLKSYLSKQASFQLPVSKASEILAAGEEERREDLDDDVYICVSSPEEAPASPVSEGLEDHLPDQKSLVHVQTSAGSGISSGGVQVDLPTVPQNVLPDNLQTGDATKDNEKCNDFIVLKKPDDMEVENILSPLASHDLPAELIVSITSAGRSVTDKTQGVVSTVSTARHSDFPFSGLLLTSENNLVSDETGKTVLDCSKDSNPQRTKRRKLQSRLSKRQEETSMGCVGTPSLQTPGEKDSLSSRTDEHNKESSDHTPLSNPSRTDWRKLPRKRRFGKLSTRNKKARFATLGLAIAKEKKTDLGQPTLERTILMHLEAGPLKKKTERWDLKAVVSECGRVLVPHGSVDIADQIKSLKNNFQPTKDEQCPEKMLLDAPVNAADTTEMEQVSSTAPETAVDETKAAESTDDGNHVQNVTVHHVDPEQSGLSQPDGESPSVPLSPESKVHSSKKGDIVTPPSPPEQEKRPETLPQGRSPAKGEFLFSKLKSVILRGKRKANLTMTEDTTANTSPDSEPCLKKDKVESNIEALNRNNGATQSTDVGVEIVSKMLSVDPLFAYALGLTPKDSPDKVQTTEDRDAQQRKDSTVMIELTSFDKEPKIIHRPPSIFPRGTRIKTLKKHQGIPAEYIRKKWWLHFQTPACFASEKLNNKDCTRDNSVRKTVKEKVNSACSSTDALNLLADLALSANNDQVLPQPSPALERKPETSLKKSDLIKGLSSSEQESVLHALLRQPAARSIQALESPSPSQLVGDSELVGLISKEHGYSLPPSSSLHLGLPGTPFQVCPVSGSTRLLHHQQTMNGDGVKTLHPSVGQEDRSDHNRTPEYLKKYMVQRRKFRYSRNFVNKEGSIQVTRQWKDNYDFNLDSKFTSDSKEKAIVRALHGPWDFSIQDTSEEVRLIVHMWIGLFYSRSTARFFHVDSNFTYPCLEDGNSLNIGITSKPADPELKANSPAASPSITDSSDPLISKVLDLSKKPNSVSDQESVVLDLSLRNANAEAVTPDPQVHRKETFVSSEQKEAAESLTSLKLPTEPSTFQCYEKMIHSTNINSEMKDDRSTLESEKNSTPQKSVCLEHTDVPSFRNDGTLTPPQKEMRSESVEPENVQTALGIGQVLHGCKNERTDMKNGTENPETTEMTQKDQLDSSKSVTDKETDSSMEASDVVHADESKDEESCFMEEDPSHESNTDTSVKVVHQEDGSASKDSSIICNGHCSDNEELLLKEKPEAVSPDQPENDNVDVDCEGKVIKGEEYFREEHGLDEKKHCISAVEADKDLSDQPLLVMSDGSDLVNADCIAESSHQAQLDEQQSPADSVKVACHDSQSTLPCTNDIALTDEHAISEKVPHTPSEMQPIDDDPAAEESSETAVSVSDEGTSSLDESCAGLSVPQKKDGVEMEHQKPEMSPFTLDLCRNAHEDPESKSTEGEDKVENITQNESFQHQSPLPQHEVLKMFNFTEEADLKIDDTNEELDGSCGGVYIPFIGIATCGEDTMQIHGSHPQDKVQKVQGHEKIPFISDTTDPETVLPNEMCSTPKITTELFPCKLSILEANETNHSVILGSESDSRCPTPTMDENPFGYIPSCGPSISTSDGIGYETCKNIVQKGLGRSSTPINDDPVFKQNLAPSAGKSDPNLHHDFHPDLEQRTLRVLQSIDKFLSKSNLTGKSRQITTGDITESFAPNRNSKCIPTGQSIGNTSADIKNKKRNNEKPAASDRRDLYTVSPACPHTLPFENALEKVHTKFQLERTNSSSYFERPDKQESLAGQDFCHSDISSPSIEHLHVIKPNTDQERHKATTQPNLNHEPRPYSQRPVMAVKPSKSEESQAGPSSKDVCVENSAKNKQTEIPDFKYALAISKLLEKKRKATLRGNSNGLNDECEARELSSKSTWQANVCHNKPNSDEVKFASHQYQGRDTSEFTAIPSSSSSAAKTSPKLVDATQDFLVYSSAEKVDRTTKKNIEMHQINVSDASASFIDPADNSRMDDSLTLGPQSSLVCTVFNSDRRKSSSFLEQLSQRCLQDDITQTSVEQECLIFSEKMKQLLKKRKEEAVCQQDTNDSLRVSCTSPVTVCFSNLDEQDDSLDLMDMSMVGQKFKVDLSDRENQTDTTKTLHPEELSQTTSNPMENAWVCSVTAECARMYETTMQDICAVEKISFKPKSCRMDRDYPKTEPSNHFDFCDQMKREMDEAFRSSLNSVVKKSCKTKYRFYILVTSDDVFFEETKAQLEAEGHTAVQPSEFFLGEESSSSLLIILRNEDIAEHICEVPHLLELKKSPVVQFAGIDEPDDVVNLTHQELFTRGGFIMFDRAALEHLSLCNMKKLADILQELSSNGKWKWMLHYRDSRRLKENARLNAEAKEKKDFLHWGQDAGILEVLPYHECDLMSRDQPDYLACLIRLQVQNISSRYPVFITDTTTDSAFERNGILTITLNSFLTNSPTETFTV